MRIFSFYRNEISVSILIFTCINLLLNQGNDVQAQTYPPSCVITYPHSNTYTKATSSIILKAYATDIGKSKENGTVARVEFYNDQELLGEAELVNNKTYIYTWDSVPEGEYRITAKAYNEKGISFTSAGVYLISGKEEIATYGISACKGKYLGNIIPNAPQTDYNKYWNAVTAENSCKWQSVEYTRDVFNWTYADIAYNFAQDNHLAFRYHTIAWGSQYPKWIEEISKDVNEFQSEIEEYMSAISERYKYIDQIDVLNENLHKNTWNGKEHAAGTPFFREGLGGEGSTGYDWLIWLFEKAREYFPNSKLVINDYELENNFDGIDEMLEAIKILRDRGLIDGFGTQAHYFNVDGISSDNLKKSLNAMAKGGVPIYVTELDMRGGQESENNEDEQLSSYKKHFPIYWEHPDVAGVTLWGYISGSTWATGTGLFMNGNEKAALQWLQEYLSNKNTICYPFCNTSNCSNIVSTTNKDNQAETIFYPNPAQNTLNLKHNDQTLTIELFDILGKKQFELKNNEQGNTSIDISSLRNGVYTVVIHNPQIGIVRDKLIICK